MWLLIVISQFGRSELTLDSLFLVPEDKGKVLTLLKL